MLFKILATFICVAVYAQLSLAQNYVAEGYFVVDEKALDKYINEIPETAIYSMKRKAAIESMTKDIDYLLTEANKLLSTLSSDGVNVQIRKRSLKFLDTDLFNATVIFDNNVVDVINGLKILETWLESQNAYTYLKYDFAMLYTGYDLSGSSGIYTAGVANTGRICDEKRALSLVEFGATYRVALDTAHEVAHLLGSSHDGSASQHVMASISGPATANRWTFSGCSASDIKDYMPLLEPNCLLSTNTASTKPSTTWYSYEGQMFDTDVICQRALNDSRSYMCKSPSLYEDAPSMNDFSCEAVYCRIPETIYCTYAFPSEGMICSKSKRCSSGKCQPDTSVSAARVDANCAFGDQKVLNYTNIEFYGTCREYIDKYGKQVCYGNSTSVLCCATCKEENTGIKGCEYGDKSIQCMDFTRAQVCPRYKDDLCCGYCQGYVGKRSTGEDSGYGIILETGVEKNIVVDEEVVKVQVLPDDIDEED